LDRIKNNNKKNDPTIALTPLNKKWFFLPLRTWYKRIMSFQGKQINDSSYLKNLESNTHLALLSKKYISYTSVRVIDITPELGQDIYKDHLTTS
jgi:hypothetical protein